MGRIRIIFEFARDMEASLITDPEIRCKIPKKLAYVEWYTKLLSNSKDINTGMFILENAQDNFGHQEVAIISIEDIMLSAHLVPHFSNNIPKEWNSSNVFKIVYSMNEVLILIRT